MQPAKKPANFDQNLWVVSLMTMALISKPMTTGRLFRQKIMHHFYVIGIGLVYVSTSRFKIKGRVHYLHLHIIWNAIFRENQFLHPEFWLSKKIPPKYHKAYFVDM